MQQEDTWVTCFIYEDCEVVYGQQKTVWHFPTNVQQQFLVSTLPWKLDHCTKEEFFQDIVDKSRILDGVGNEEKDESIIILETPYPINDNNILEQSRIDYIETWFQSIAGQAMPSDSQHI